MHIFRHALWALASVVSLATAAANSSTAGVEAFVKRRIPHHADKFEFRLHSQRPGIGHNETYTVSTASNGKITVEGSTISALTSGLHRYLADEAHVDIWWFAGSQLDRAPDTLPALNTPIHGSSVVPWRYLFNTVTTSYTTPFWSWEEWETQLDWMALRGINIALAWIGVEKIFLDVFRDIGLTDREIASFLSGPAFLAWNHLGNIQGSWGGDLPETWINQQSALQGRILRRMAELGITPILPAFPGFVPENITRVWPNASVARSSQWEGFPEKYTNVTYLTPYDSHFAQMQRLFVRKQQRLYGNVTNFWALDQFNENEPASGDLGYLSDVSRNTWRTLKQAAGDAAVWVMQGWLFASDSTFWSVDRIKAFLDGVPEDKDMLILDLFAESQPQWQRTESFFGKPWVWCQLHGYGGNMGLYGQVENVTRNAIEAVRESPSIAGLGLTMEGQEGNEIMYDLLLDQAWSKDAIDTAKYFHSWVSTRYGGKGATWGPVLPQDLYSAWDAVRPTVYNNTDSSVTAVTKSILTLMPDISGLVNRTGHHPTKLTYDPDVLVQAWSKLYRAGWEDAKLFSSPTYRYDLTDWTRQVLANAFQGVYEQLVAAYHDGDDKQVKRLGNELQLILHVEDAVLSSNENFRLQRWVDSAGRSGGEDGRFFEYDARNQVTLWGPRGEVEDYASKEWSGLVVGYYARRWSMFVEYLGSTPVGEYNQTEFKAGLEEWEGEWVDGGQSRGDVYDEEEVSDDLLDVMTYAIKTVPHILVTQGR